MSDKSILVIMTSHDTLGETGEPTGYWLEELAAPYYAFVDGGATVTLASPKGGRPPVDPKSTTDAAQTADTNRFVADVAAQAALEHTTKLAEIDVGPYDGVFFPGGHGPLWDLYTNPDSIRIIEQAFAAGKPVAAVCHGPAALLQAKAPNGESLLAGKALTGFSNTEEAAVGLTTVVPFSLEDRLAAVGRFQRGEDWQPHVVTDGLVITGQNPASSARTAQALLSIA